MSLIKIQNKMQVKKIQNITKFLQNIKIINANCY